MMASLPRSHDTVPNRASPGAFYEFSKRLIDVAGSATLIVLLLPLGCVCALAVLFSSPGPVFFNARRLGKNGKPFLLHKFRSMYAGAPDWRNQDGSAYTGSADPRITAVGRFLRQTSLDELPQLLNVLLGDMSLVGPRPDQVDQLRYYSATERRKLEVRPGITGLAQISGRNSISWEARKSLDVEYVIRRSLWFDLKILVMTVPYVLKREGVHGPAVGREEA
jgi:undecaprenyl phosphate N,N'-diacetylbacillosamine 1-phosphate transferase